MNSAKREELRQLLQHGLQEYAAKKTIWDRAPAAVTPGDLFFFRTTDAVPVKWCVIFAHSRDPRLWFVVPADDFSLVGTRDVAVPPEADEGPLNLRCACGLWVHDEDLDISLRVGHLHFDYIEQVRDHLSRMLENDLPTVESLLDVDDDPDYLEWIEQLAEAVTALEDQLHEVHNGPDVITISAATAVQNWDESVPGYQLEHVLAADSGTPEIETGPPPPGLRVPFQGPGDLFAMVYEQGIVLQLFHVDAASLPRLIVDQASAQPIEWRKQPNWLSSSLIPWSDDHAAACSLATRRSSSNARNGTVNAWTMRQTRFGSGQAETRRGCRAVL